MKWEAAKKPVYNKYQNYSKSDFLIRKKIPKKLIKKKSYNWDDVLRWEAEAKEEKQRLAKEAKARLIKEAVKKDLQDALRNDEYIKAEVEIKQETIYDPNE